MTLDTGGTASYASAPSADTLRFSYSIVGGNTSADLAITAFNLNGDTITDAPWHKTIRRSSITYGTTPKTRQARLAPPIASN